MEEHRLEVRVYLEDTDAQGVVYHANYLKFFERARTDLLTARGVERSDLSDRLRFVVHEMNIRFRRPARLGDGLTVVSRCEAQSEFRLVFSQRALRGEELLVEARVDVVCVNTEGGLIEIPPALRTA